MNGFITQWGKYSKAKDTWVTFPLSAGFTQIPVVIAHTTENATVHSTIYGISKSGFYTKACQYSTSSEARDGNYIAIGY